MRSDLVGPAPSQDALAAGAVVWLHGVSGSPLTHDHDVLTDEERSRAARFRRPADRARFVVARAAVRRHLGAALGVAPDAVPVVIAPGGRPTLAPELGSDITFSLSHSGDWCAVALAKGRQVGVDIESWDVDRDVASLIPGLMGARERRMLSGLSGDGLAEGFYGCWTRKEAIVKAMGRGLSFPVERIDVPAGGVVYLPTGPTDEAELWTLNTERLSERYTISTALAGDGVTIRANARSHEISH